MLDEVGIYPLPCHPRTRWEITVERTDDAASHRPRKLSERRPDREHWLALSQRIRVAKLDSRRRRSIHAHNGKITEGIGSDEARVSLLTTRKDYFKSGPAAHDVLVRYDVPRAVDHESRAASRFDLG